LTASGSARAPTGALPRAPSCECEDRRGAPSNILRPCWHSRLPNAGQSRITAAVPHADAPSCSAYVPRTMCLDAYVQTAPTTAWRSCLAEAIVTGCGSAIAHTGCAQVYQPIQLELISIQLELISKSGCHAWQKQLYQDEDGLLVVSRQGFAGCSVLSGAPTAYQTIYGHFLLARLHTALPGMIKPSGPLTVGACDLEYHKAGFRDITAQTVSHSYVSEVGFVGRRPVLLCCATCSTLCAQHCVSLY